MYLSVVERDKFPLSSGATVGAAAQLLLVSWLLSKAKATIKILILVGAKAG